MSQELVVKENKAISLQPQNMDQLIAVSEILAKTELVPTTFQGKPNDIVASVMLGNEIGLSPMQSLRSVAIINGRASLWGDAMIALVMSSNVYKSIVETFDDTTMTATCIATRKNGTCNTQTFNQKDATLAGLWSKKGPWSQYPKRMLKMRARSFCLRDTFPDVLGGFIAAEEAQDTPPPPKQIEAKIVNISEEIYLAKSMKELMAIYESLDESDIEKYSAEFTKRKNEVLANEKRSV